MVEDRYLDSSRFLRELEEAERNHQLDEQGVLAQLIEAAKHCEIEGGKHLAIGNEYMLASAAYFAEANRRVALPWGNGARLSNGRRQGEGFKEFCRKVGRDTRYAHRLVKVGNSADPATALEELRNEARAASRKSRKKNKDAAAAAGVPSGTGATSKDPLRPIMIEWYKLSPVRQIEFLRRIGISQLDPLAGAQEWIKSNPLRMAAE